MKKLVLFAMTVACLSIFNACEKSEELINQGVDVYAQNEDNDFLFEGLDTILFSVNKNCLVFENEKEFQKCINFLAQLGDKNFPAFENKIGFESFRKKHKGEMSSYFVDDLYKTLLNPEMEIIIGDYLFKEDPINKITLAYRIENTKSCDLKSAKTNLPDYNFSWNDEAFAIINGNEIEPGLKSGCTGNHDHKKDWIIQSSTYPPPIPQSAYAYRVEVKSKLNFQTTAIFKSIIAKIKTESFDHGGMVVNGQLFTLKLSMYGTYEYDRNNESKRSGTVNEYRITNTSQDGVEWRPFYGTKRVNCYDVVMTFKWEVWANPVSPQFFGQNEIVTQVLQCNAGNC